MSDIQQMFHQVLTNQDDQQALRFCGETIQIKPLKIMQ